MGQAATWKPVATTIVRNVGEISEQSLPLLFAALDEGRSTKLKERAAQAVVIYNNAIRDGYVSQREVNLFRSATFELREMPFRHIDKAYPPVRNPNYKRLVAEKLDAGERWYDIPKTFPNPNLPNKPTRCGGEKTTLTLDASYFSNRSFMCTTDEFEKDLPDHLVKAMALAAYKEIKLLDNASEYLESLVKSSTEIKAITDRRMMPATTKAAFKVVEEILTKMTDQVKGEYIRYHYDRASSDIADFLLLSRPEQLKMLKLDQQSKADLQARNETAKAKLKEETGRDWGFRAEKRTEVWIESSFSLLTGQDHFEIENEPMKALTNWEALVLDNITGHAEYIQKFFVNRAGYKIAVIVEAKELKGNPTVLNATAVCGVIEGNILFNFKDGSHFTVRHKIVEKVVGNWRGTTWTRFCQFPTTFHNAVMADGKEMPGQPSEQEMKTVFIGATKRQAS